MFLFEVTGMASEAEAGGRSAEWETRFKVVRNDKFAMLKSETAYASSLPMREVGGIAKMLFELPFLSKRADVQAMAKELSKAPQLQEGSRKVVPYLSAPGAYGKTSSIWPAYLENENLGLYVYMPFDNNGPLHHEGPTRDYIDGVDAEKAGAAFILSCLDLQLRRLKYISRPGLLAKIKVWFTRQKAIEAKINALLTSVSPNGKLILIHLDEHKKMLDDPGDRAAAFRRAAVEALLSVPFVRLVLTYTEPPALPAVTRSSSGLARVALAFTRAAADEVFAFYCSDIDEALKADNHSNGPFFEWGAKEIVHPEFRRKLTTTA
eukprot:4205862-Amphidinium_carterae.2